MIRIRGDGVGYCSGVYPSYRSEDCDWGVRAD